MKACCAIGDQNHDCPSKTQTKIAIVGNPNSGKTTLFNMLTGARQLTGNWPGVTVEHKEGTCKLLSEEQSIIDLPGTYSLDSHDASADEQIARQFIFENPDFLYLNVVDVTTLERGLYLTVQLRELGVNTVVLLNMMDHANKRGMKIEHKKLAADLGCPVVPITLHNAKETFAVYRSICNFDSASTKSLAVHYSKEVELAVSGIQESQDIERVKAVWLLENPGESISANELREKLQQQTCETPEFLIADARFNLAASLGKRAISEFGKISKTASDTIDKWVLGSWTGIPVFLFMIYLLFVFSINLGGAFIDFFDIATGALAVDGLEQLMEAASLPQWLITIVAEGIGGGIQVVGTFIPIIGTLYLFLTFLEQSGYMARAAFVMDALMRRIGISGKAFVPLIVGFGCNVPSIMAARTLESERERILAVMMAPFMSCGARLAVYVLFAAAFFPHNGQNIVFLLYIIGILFAIFTAWLFKKTVLKGKTDDFIMELPKYQVPRLRDLLINTWNKLKGFVFGAGKIIIIVVAIINVANSVGVDGSFGNNNTERSVLSVTAKVVTPVFSPMGIDDDNWPATVGIMTGLLAKEVVVGTLDALYSNIANNQNGHKEEKEFSLGVSLLEAVKSIPLNLAELTDSLIDPLGFSDVVETKDLQAAADAAEVSTNTVAIMIDRFNGHIGAFAYLLFILMYFPCVAATGAIYREIGSNWTLMAVFWTTSLAYVVAVVFYQTATFSEHPVASVGWISGLMSYMGLIVWRLAKAGNKTQSRVSYAD